MNKDAVIATLRRTVVQIVIIAVTAILFIIIMFVPSRMSEDIKNQLLSIVTGIFTGAFLSLVYVVVEKKYDDQQDGETEKRIDNRFDDVLKAVQAIHLPDNCVYCKFYIRSLQNRDSLDLQKMIDESKKRVCILETNLQSYIGMQSSIERAVKRGVNVKILVLKPTSQFVKLRHKEIGFDTARGFFDEMQISLKAFIKSRDEMKINLSSNLKYEIRTHLHFPSCMIFIIDHKLIFNPILPIGKARTTSHIVYDTNQNDAKKMAENFQMTFDECWKGSEEAKKTYEFNESQLETWS